MQVNNNKFHNIKNKSQMKMDRLPFTQILFCPLSQTRRYRTGLRGHRGRGRMFVGLTTTCATNFVISNLDHDEVYNIMW